MEDRFNTIAGWVLGAGIVALGGSIVAGETFHSGRPEKMGYPIAGVAAEGAGGEAEQPIAFFLAKADAAKGAQVFNKCTACHNATKGGPNGLGPNLWGVLGEPVGKGKGFAFSDALSKIGGTWNWDNLDHWLASPRAMAPGTKMTFAGLGNPQERADVIAYLNQQSDSPLPLPAAPAAAAPAAGDKDAVPADGNTAAPADGNAAAPAEANAAAPAEASIAAPEPKKP
ncbi:MAG: cytochrome c family protein [Sphingomicrobium sp.]